MNEVYKAKQITEHVWWVGAIDWNIRDFHGYSTSRGTTYNAFLVMGEKIALIDTVKAPFYNEMMSRITSVIDPEKIDYIISNHAEMDHTGALIPTIDRVKPEKVLASKQGVKAINAQLHLDYEVSEVKSAETLDLGGLTLEFLETRMLHWPDSMFTYLKEEKLLFSQDAFGMHLASGQCFADQVDRSVLEFEATKYYANILMLFGPFVEKVLAKVGEMGWELDIIAPDHGPIWREKDDIGWILGKYAEWASCKSTKKAVIVYATMWGSTHKMAQAIGEGLSESGVDVKMLSLNTNHRSDVATEVLDAAVLLVGSPTMNNNMHPKVADVLTYLKGLKPKNLIGQSFGSYGWGGESIKQVADVLEAMQVEAVGEPLKIRYVPTAEDLKTFREFGKLLAEKIESVIS